MPIMMTELQPRSPQKSYSHDGAHDRLDLPGCSEPHRWMPIFALKPIVRIVLAKKGKCWSFKRINADFHMFAEDEQGRLLLVVQLDLLKRSPCSMS